MIDSEQGLEKAMAPHSSTLAWRILWTEEPGGPTQGSNPGLPHLQADALTSEPPGKQSPVNPPCLREERGKTLGNTFCSSP